MASDSAGYVVHRMSVRTKALDATRPRADLEASDAYALGMPARPVPPAATGGTAEGDSWSPSSWQPRPAPQLPDWPDDDALGAVRARLSSLPPLVFAGEARTLQSSLATV